MFLEEVLADTVFSESEQLQLVLAVEEVCSNLIIHSHGCNPDQFIEVKVSSTDTQFLFEIFDFGEGFNILEYKDPDISEVVKSKRKGGLGIILVKRIMDKIEFESIGNKNVCRLFKVMNSK